MFFCVSSKMMRGTWCICYQVGSCTGRWCTSTLIVTSVSTTAPVLSTTPFFGECYNDDTKYGLFMTRTKGRCNGKEIVWEQFIPTQWSYDVSTVYFKGVLGYYKDVINHGRIFSLTGKENEKMCQGGFSGRWLPEGLGRMRSELPAEIVAVMIDCQCICLWTLMALRHGGKELACWLLLAGYPEGFGIQEAYDIQAYIDNDHDPEEEIMKHMWEDASWQIANANISYEQCNYEVHLGTWQI